jgi:hypothetical protein
MNKLITLTLRDTLFQDHSAANSIADSPTTLFNSILPNVYVIASIILLLYLVAGGFMMITAASSAEQAQKGQQAVTNAIMGFLIIFGSYWIIQVIQIVTGVPILNSII